MEIFFSDSISGPVITLSGDESLHCARVLRHRAGDLINVIDGQGTLYRCTLDIADARECTARIVDTVPGFGSHTYRLTMAVCPTKNTDRYEWFAEKVTEIGVDSIVPVIGERSERRVLKTDRLRRIVLSAVKQSLKGAIPQVREPLSVKEFIESVPEDAVKMICYCFEDQEKHSVAEVLGEARSGQGVTDIFILIGPEGDFSPAEAELARSRGWRAVTLGSSRLRTETAAIVAATQVYSCF